VKAEPKLPKVVETPKPAVSKEIVEVSPVQPKKQEIEPTKKSPAPLPKKEQKPPQLQYKEKKPEPPK
jgi:hypothetical protein